MITWPYLAGFVDCDGWITSSKNKNCSTRRYLIGLTQSAKFEKEMRMIHDFLSVNGIKSGFVRRSISPSSNLKGNYPMVNIHIKAQLSVISFLEETMAFMLIKKDKATECYNYTLDRIIKTRGNPVKSQVKKKYWSKNETQRLMRLHVEGYSNNVIAEKLERSSNSVGHKLYRLGVVRSYG